MNCFECGKAKCKIKIICYTEKWEYASCSKHAHNLQVKADREIKQGIIREHITSAEPLKKELSRKK